MLVRKLYPRIPVLRLVIFFFKTHIRQLLDHVPIKIEDNLKKENYLKSEEYFKNEDHTQPKIQNFSCAWVFSQSVSLTQYVVLCACLPSLEV